MANVAYSDIVVVSMTVSETEVQGTLQNYKRASGVTENHVIINESLPTELKYNATWTTGDGYFTLDYDQAIYSTQVTFSVYLGIPVNT